MTRTLTITATEVPSGTVLALAGDLHLHTAGQLRDILKNTELDTGQQLIIDMKALEFCDSSGIAALVAAYRHAQKSRAAFALTAPTPRLARLLALSGLDRFLALYPTTTEAQAAWTPPSS